MPFTVKPGHAYSEVLGVKNFLQLQLAAPAGAPIRTAIRQLKENE
jgi:hypothetical protein